MIWNVISLAVSLTALWVALRRPAAAPPKNAPARPPKSELQRQAQAVVRQEWENFMHYDGSEQPPIDPLV